VGFTVGLSTLLIFLLVLGRCYDCYFCTSSHPPPF